MTNIKPGFTELTLRAMAKPEDIDIRDYMVIPFKGKLKMLTGVKHTPFKMIHIVHDKRKISIQVFFLKDKRKAYISDMIYEQYKSEINTYFSAEFRENIHALNNSDADKHNDSLFQTDETSDVLLGKRWIKTNPEKGVVKRGGKRVLRGQELKDYLLSDFGDRDYKRKSIIDIYSYNRDYFISLKREKKIEQEAIDFFTNSCFLLEEAQKIPTEAFRKLKYDEIVSEYVKDHSVIDEDSTDSLLEEKTSAELAAEKEIPIAAPGEKKEKSDKKSANKVIVAGNLIKAKEKQDILLHCVKDYAPLIKCDVLRVHNKKDKAKSLDMPVYACPECMRLYTSIDGYKDLMKIKFQGDIYTNLRLLEDSRRYDSFLSNPHPLEPGSKCYIYQTKKPLKCKICQRPELKRRGVYTGNSSYYHTLFCPYCNIHYLKWDEYKKRYLEWNLLNPEEYQSILEEKEREKEERRRKQEIIEEEQRKKQEERNAEIKARKELRKQEKERKKQEELRRKKELEENRKRERELREKQMKISQQLYDKQVKSHLNDGDAPAKMHDNRIRVKDFVVRRTTFKCMHEGHALQNIDGIVEIINDKGNIIQTRVPAGYCPNCNVFFIMESTYQRLKMKGTPICRISDEKTYMKGNIYANGMRLAQESVLMQYGYSVSQQEGLSANRRSKILAVLIDNDILTRTEIISYLDFFINQRKNNPKYEKAIEKWEMDREFVSEYKVGAYTQYGISGISRKY